MQPIIVYAKINILSLCLFSRLRGTDSFYAIVIFYFAFYQNLDEIHHNPSWSLDGIRRDCAMFGQPVLPRETGFFAFSDFDFNFRKK